MHSLKDAVCSFLQNAGDIQKVKSKFFNIDDLQHHVSCMAPHTILWKYILVYMASWDFCLINIAAPVSGNMPEQHS
jgi:hypothetical protein